MKTESGRSLIEIIGVIAIGAVMTVAAVKMYNTMRNNHTRTVAESQIKQIATDVKLLLETRGNYSDVSVNYLIKAGALKTDQAPIGGDNWSINSSADGLSFSINLTELTQGECAYFSSAVPKWAQSIIVNGFELGDNSDKCFSTPTNQISFIVE